MVPFIAKSKVFFFFNSLKIYYLYGDANQFVKKIIEWKCWC
jgi:hypothetical protein